MSDHRHALNKKTKVYLNRKLPDATVESKTSKGLASKWFRDWKQFQKIQTGKSYAQALILGREMNPGPVYSRTSQSSIPKNQVFTDQKRQRYTTCENNNQTTTIQTSASSGSKSGGSVAGASRVRETPVQIQLTNRFQVLQDKLSHEVEDQQWGQSFSDTSKQAKSHKNEKVTSNSTTVTAKVHNFHSPKQSHTTVFQKSQDSDSLVYSPKNLNRDDVTVDTDSHTTDYLLAINRNSEPDNNLLLHSSPQDMENILGTVNPGMCLDQQKCIQQTGGYFGFVPQTSLKIYKGTPVHWEKIPSILEAHHLVTNSGTHNYLKCRIPVNSHLKIHNWTHFLKDYWDQQIVDLLHYGFPLDLNRTSPLTPTHDNHKFAITDVEHVRRFVKEELQHQAIMGSFDTVPYNFHLSPLMTRAKQDSDKKRTIMDLSWPPGQSVNAGVKKDIYLNTPYSLHYPSIDNITEALVKLGPAAQVYKVDISRAFRHLRIDPADIDLLGFQVDGRHFIDVSMPFGFRHGSLFFQRCSDAIRYIMASHGYKGLYNYIDDLIYIGLPSEIQDSYQFLLKLLQDLGLDISVSKLVSPSTSVICLDILVDTINKTISIPEQKLQEIKDTCRKWPSKTYCSKTELQSLLGLLLYITKCVKPARFFLNRMLQLLRDNHAVKKILLNADLTWFRIFLSQYNGVTYYHQTHCHFQMHLDASLTGLGAVFKDMVYSLPLPRGYMGYNIAQLEILNIVVACKVWASHWANQKIRIWCDNQAVVEVLTTGKCRDSTLAVCARNIWLISATHNFQIKVQHIAGHKNVTADLLSRWTNSSIDNSKLNTLVPGYVWIPTHPNLTLLNYDI